MFLPSTALLDLGNIELKQAVQPVEEFLPAQLRQNEALSGQILDLPRLSSHGRCLWLSSPVRLLGKRIATSARLGGCNLVGLNAEILWGRTFYGCVNMLWIR